jgi:hypothetical protein
MRSKPDRLLFFTQPSNAAFADPTPRAVPARPASGESSVTDRIPLGEIARTEGQVDLDPAGN